SSRPSRAASTRTLSGTPPLLYANAGQWPPCRGDSPGQKDVGARRVRRVVVLGAPAWRLLPPHTFVVLHRVQVGRHVCLEVAPDHPVGVGLEHVPCPPV